MSNELQNRYSNKKTTLKGQITLLTNAFNNGNLSHANLKLRVKRLEDHFYALEGLNDELALANPDNHNSEEFRELQDKFYDIASKIEERTNPNVGNTVQRNNAVTSEQQPIKRRLKLPAPKLPSFDGSFEKWLTFKNAFTALIDADTELSDASKLSFLHSALSEDALRKINLLDITNENYKKAWEILTEAYEVKRIQVTRYYELLFSLPVQERETTEGLSSLIDNAQQHIASLSSLGIELNPSTIVYLLESKLPKRTMERWDQSLQRNEIPTPETLIEFLRRTAAIVSRKRPSTVLNSSKDNPISNKFRKYNKPPNQSFAINTQSICQLLASATVLAFDKDHNSIKCRVLLDTCSTANFMTNELAHKLKLPMKSCHIPIGAINSTCTVSKHYTNVTFRSTCSSYETTLPFLTVPQITNLIPSEVFPRERFKLPHNIKLADPTFHLPRPVDLLIGAGSTISLFKIGQLTASHEDRHLHLQKTQLGWIVTGGSSDLSVHKQSPASCQMTALERQVTKFWDIEEVEERKSYSVHESKCEQIFRDTVQRDNNGRYIVRLPFRDDVKNLGESYEIALKRFNALETKLERNPDLKQQYCQVIQEYIDLNHMTLVDNPHHEGYYMPHPAVIKSTSATTKVRVVFDASVKTDRGSSLNDRLLIGPTIQEKLVTHLIRFRSYKYVITADIEKMYRQILLHESDRKYQQILWRLDGKIVTYHLNTVTFGIASSPFLAIRTLHQLAQDEKEFFPRASQALSRELYVDDLLTGAESIEEAINLRDQLIALLSKGCFNIRQWASNDARILKGLPTKNLNSHLTVEKDCALKTLGIMWQAHDDLIIYSTNMIAFSKKYTKRNILSDISKIFDPLGLLGPIILHAKKIIQDLWQAKVHWDESIPSSIYSDWASFVTQLQLLDNISIHRRSLVDKHTSIQIHAFCDASAVGYGACIYLRSMNAQGEYLCTLICAKSRVAPIKTVTIPRLELNAARLLVRLFKETQNSFEFKPDKIVFWSDSSVALHWIKNTSPRLLNTYVSNRVSEIQTKSSTDDWRHVPTESNPADALSRGQLPAPFLENPLWFHGPSWLRLNENEWPNKVEIIKQTPEIKKTVCLLVGSVKSSFIEKCSSYSKLLRLTSYFLRARPKNTFTGPLSVDELNEAEIRIIKLVQREYFTTEIDQLSKGETNSKTRLATLNPFIDLESDGLLKVGGRLQNSSLPVTQKHPILLPQKCHLTDLIIREYHEKNHHLGITGTLYALRNKFWVLDGRNQIRKIIRNCVRCFRFNAQSTNYKMGNLPAARVQNARPFKHTGVDFCGPFFIKEKKFRNRGKIKIYVCVFVCMAIKAVHLKVVSDLTTEGFLGAFRRFIARRGTPSDMYSDNGTNFVGANNELDELYTLLRSETHKNQVNSYALARRITWHFNPPLSPNFGGLWEAGVKSFKHHLKRVVGDRLFTYEEFETFVTEIEAILNSRPLTYISSDPNDPLVLSPAHYLIGESLIGLPECDFTDTPCNRLSVWQHIVKVRQDFWRRWYLEYLNELQQRTKWTNPGKELQVGAVILIKDKQLPCLQWRMGRIAELIPGADGVNRVAWIQTSTGRLKRNTKLLCPLPIAN